MQDKRNIVEAIIVNNPEAVAYNLERLGIANVSDSPANIALVIQNLNPKKGQELELLSSILDVPIIEGRLGYDMILQNISTKKIVKNALRDFFPLENNFNDWERKIKDRFAESDMISITIYVFVVAFLCCLLFSLLSKLIVR